MTRGATIKVLAVYWALLAFGVTMYTAIRSDALETLAPVWIGTLVGTLLGQVLGLRSARSWFVLIIVIGGGILWIPQLPETLGYRAVWMAYVPAALCGYWVLGDRSSLIAFWFPAVIWMLSILDGTGPNAVPDATGMILLGALALLFVVFLRVREERRIALWKTVAHAPLAQVKPIVTLHEGSAGKLPRIAWIIAMSALGFAATMWIAPKLWQAQTFDGGHFQVAAQHHTLRGLPCCPRHAVAPATRARLKEYFDLGRGHEAIGPAGEELGCRVCTGSTVAEAATIDLPADYTAADYARYGGDPTPYGGYAPQFNAHAAYEPAGSTGYSETPVASADYPSQVGHPVLPAPEPRIDVPGEATVTPHVAPVPPPAPVVQPPAPAPIAPTPPPVVQPPPTPAVAPPAPRELPPSPPRAAPSNDPPPEVTADEAAPEVRVPSQAASTVLHWAAILLGTLLLGQVIALVLRPVRRAIALRHLERPFWDETVDQRVSNAWQLALIGLRDGGWRTSGHESPAALAKRVDLPGMEKCATILERTRHGIGIDHDDLADMTASAVTVYRGARARTTAFARTVSWLRWPLA